MNFLCIKSATRIVYIHNFAAQTNITNIKPMKTAYNFILTISLWFTFSIAQASIADSVFIPLKGYHNYQPPTNGSDYRKDESGPQYKRECKHRLPYAYIVERMLYVKPPCNAEILDIALQNEHNESVWHQSITSNQHGVQIPPYLNGPYTIWIQCHNETFYGNIYLD